MKFLRAVLLPIVLFVLAPIVGAQQVPAEAAVSWVLPSAAADGSPLTGGQSLTKLQVWAATAPIPDNAGGSPTAELGASATQWKFTTTAPNGGTLYFRLKACNAGGCGAFSQQASKTVQVNVPGVPTGVQVTVTVTVTAP